MTKKAVFVGGQLFWDMFLAYRVAWIMGRYGAGKTSLAVIMAARLLVEKRVELIASNIPLTFSKPINPLLPFVNAGIVLDESWIYLESRQSVLDYAAFIRKFNHYLLLPSVFPIHPRLSYFFVQRVFNAYTIGFPFWVYKWNISNKGIKEHGHFAIQNPVAVFGSYPSEFVPSDDAGISDAVTNTARLEAEKSGKKLPAYLGARSKNTKNAKDKNDDFSVEEFDEVAFNIENAKDDFNQILKAFKRGR